SKTSFLFDLRQPHQNLFAGRRRAQLRDRAVREVRQRVLDGAENGDAEQEGRFADGLAGADVHRVRLVLDVIEVEYFRHILNVWDLVRGRRVRQQLADRRVTNLPVGQPAGPLDESAGHLAAIDARIERLTDVHQHVAAQNP